jgi:transmembrane sensor
MTINEKIKDDALSWIIKEKEGLNQEEKKSLEKFLNNSLNAQEYNKCQNFFADLNGLEDIDKNNIKQNIDNDKKVLKFNKVFTPIAASILLISFLSYFYYDEEKLLYTKTYQTYNTKKVNIHLPDDSLIDLDAKSILNVNYYKHKRLVNFPTGKAVFSISKNKDRPFIIRSNNTQIEVIGTKFEVISVQNINTINVIEGIVRVSNILNEKTKNLIVLKKGESFTLNNKGKNLKLGNININNIAKWKEDLLKFDNITLKDAFKEFKRYTDRKIILKDYEVENFRISGIFSIKDIDKFINSLGEIYDLNIVKNKNEIQLSSK